MIRKLRSIVHAFREARSFRRVSYSQIYEDVVMEMIASFLGMSISNYLDIGAHNPRVFSNTYLFYRKGARGVVVDPNPRLRNLYKKYRPGDIFLNAAVGSTSNGQSLRYYTIDPDTLSTTDAAKAAETAALGHPILSTSEVPVVSLQKIVADNFPGQKLDLLSLDVEGSEEDVLNSNDWEQCRPLVICLETLEYHPPIGSRKRWKLIEYMTAKGYVRVGETWLNSIFIDGERLKLESEGDMSGKVDDGAALLANMASRLTVD